MSDKKKVIPEIPWGLPYPKRDVLMAAKKLRNEITRCYENTLEWAPSDDRFRDDLGFLAQAIERLFDSAGVR